MKKLPWKYLAGLIDGEGCIDVQVNQKVYIRPRLRITMTEPGREVLTYAHNSYGGFLCERKAKDARWTDSISWECTGYKHACPILRNVFNHLFIKKEQARFCLWLEQNIKGQRVSAEVRDAVRKELKLMKRDPHRLSEKAGETIRRLL